MRFLFRRMMVVGVAFGLLSVLTPVAGAVDSTTLVEKSARYDGKIITFRGEVIGDIMRRREGVWVNVNDDAYSRQGPRFRLAGYNAGQGVLLPRGRAAKITRAGNYRQRGDIIEVTGVFRAASEKHGGEMMIEGRSVRIIKKGFPLESPISRRKILFAIVSLTLAASLAALEHYLKAQRRRPRSE